jgi:hypothetical protein
MVQVEPIGTRVPQVLLCENELALAPDMVMLETGMGTAAWLVTVNFCGALEMPTCTLPNPSELGESEKGVLPVPLSATAAVSPGPTLTFSVAVCPPVDVGVN